MLDKIKKVINKIKPAAKNIKEPGESNLLHAPAVSPATKCG